MGGACSTYGEKGGAYRILVANHKGKRPLERNRCRWEHNIKLDLQDVGGMVWIRFICFRIVTGGDHLSTRLRIFGLHKMRRIS